MSEVPRIIPAFLFRRHRSFRHYGHAQVRLWGEQRLESKDNRRAAKYPEPSSQMLVGLLREIDGLLRGHDMTCISFGLDCGDEVTAGPVPVANVG
jgi:hypothetical protein